MKKICALMLSLLLCMGCCFTAVHGAVSNPFQITGTNVTKGVKEFVVSIQLKESISLSAFEISVVYDSTALEVVDKEGTGFFFSDAFKKYYSNGYAVCNDKNNTEVIFAGAKTGAGNYSGTVGQIRFKVKEQAGAVADIQLNVKTVGQESSSGIVKLDVSNPKIIYNIQLNDFTGTLGDINADGTIGLKDAQLALQSALKIITLTGNQKLAADVNSDHAINLVDAQTILKKALKIIP